MISRRQFLRGDMSGRKAGPQRPPWPLPEQAFLAACTRCGDCAPACPEKIVVIRRGYPVVDFARAGCTFCAACVEVCAAGALSKTLGAPPWDIRAQIGASCIANRNVVCRSCGDACAQSAIRFSPRLGGAALPEVDKERCTGCGMCIAPCPVNAITLA